MAHDDSATPPVTDPGGPRLDQHLAPEVLASHRAALAWAGANANLNTAAHMEAVEWAHRLLSGEPGLTPALPGVDALGTAILRALLARHPERVTQEDLAAAMEAPHPDPKTVRSRLRELREGGYTHCPGRGEGLTEKGLRLARSLPPA
jgi:hypothetical protein